MDSPVDLWTRESNKRKAIASKSSCYRLVDKLNLPFDIRIDRLGDVLSFQYFSEEAPSDELLRYVHEFTQSLGLEHWFFRTMINRGKDPNQKILWKSDSAPEQWVASENDMNFVFKLNEGTSPGLFLDQRERRQWVLQNSTGKSVLNLFAYTGGFSVAAALGDAKKTVTVDVGARYIEWSKQNLEANQQKLEQHEFWTVDAFDFLEGAVKRKHLFDLIICDPPSFGRSKRGAFKLAKDYSNLLSLCSQVLSKKGRLIFSTNFEEWNQKDFEKKCYDTAKPLHLNVIEFPKPPTDFNSTILKTCLFSRT